MIYRSRISSALIPKTWLGRVVAALIAGSLAVVGLFFLAFALVAAALIAGVVLVRIWWTLRKLRAQRDASVFEGSYSIEKDVTPVIGHRASDAGLQSTDRK